jgi:hypothetical protein
MSANGTVPAAERRPRFARGDAVRLDLSEGDWILVRRELSYGQQRRLAASGLTGVDAAATEGQHLKVDLAAYDIERLVTWVMDWSFRDADGDRVTVSREAIEALHPDTAAEIGAALDVHIEAQEAKKGPSSPAPTAPGPSSSAATSSSARRSAGAGRS